MKIKITDMSKHKWNSYYATNVNDCIDEIDKNAYNLCLTLGKTIQLGKICAELISKI